MENASKALIIAGAILLSILIISLGMMVYTNSKETVDNIGNLDTEKVQVFNEKFSNYYGDKVSASKVKSLLQLIEASKSEGNTVGLDPSGSIKTTSGVVSNDKTYSVNATGYGTDGKVNKILIKQN